MLSIKKVEKLPKGIEVRDSIQMLKRNVQKYPNKMAVILQSPIWGEVRHTWQELDQVTNKLANGFISLGLKKGDHIATLLSNFAGQGTSKGEAL